MSSKNQDISKWYEAVVINSGIASPGLVKGTLFIHPRGWWIWEKIQEFVDNEFDAIGIRNVSFPSLIPVSEIEKEKEKLSGFSPELFLVSKSTEEYERRIFLRPTSEILFSYFFRKTLNSHDQLPFLFNQWCNVYRSEKNTKAFLRTCEFYWQEAHTLHKTHEEALEYLSRFHEIYKRTVRELLRIDFLEGEKTINERFQGAEKTLTLEAVMPDGQALQIATSHYLGKNFSEMFGVKYTSEENKQENPYQLSAGSSTRLIGALILTHSDDLGLVLPLGLSEYQVKVLVINGVVTDGDSVYERINDEIRYYSYSWDFSSKSFGYKIKNEEIAGTPFVIVIGDREIESGEVLVKSRLGRRDSVPIDSLRRHLGTVMIDYEEGLLEASSKNLEDSIVEVDSLEGAKREVLENRKIVLVPWFDDSENEEKFKNEKLGFGPRCIKERIESSNIKCFYSGKLANSYVYFGRSY